MERAIKEQLVEQFSDVFKNSGVVVVAHYAGLTVPQIEDLRGQMSEAGGAVKIVKNRLIKRALADTAMSEISSLFAGPTAIVYSEDPIAAPRIAAKFSKDNAALVLRGGVMGEIVLDVDSVNNLALLPSLDVLRAQIVGLLNAPATKIAGVTQAPAAQLARVMGAYAAKNEAA